MENKPTIHPTPQLAIGLIVILLGVLFTLDNLNLLDSTVYFHYWPVLLLAYGVYRLIEPGNPPHLVPGVVFTVVGGVLFLNALHFHLSIRQYWPVLLIFFDIQMPKLNGFEVLELMGADTGVIFATAYDEYALRAFEVHAVDYLLKPFGAERFGAALEHARFHLKVGRGTPFSGLIAESRKQNKPLQRILIRDGSRVHVIPVEKIDYIEAQDDYVSIKSGGKEYLKQEVMADLESLLDAGRFIRIHRSYILNIERLVKLDLYAKDSHIAILTDGSKLPVSRSGYARLKPLL